MHPLLVHAASNAMQATRQQGALYRHKIRVTFNLSTAWARRPLRYREVQRAAAVPAVVAGVTCSYSARSCLP